MISFIFKFFISNQMSNQLDLTQFNKTKIVKKMTKSKSNENLEAYADAPVEIDEPKKSNRGRKTKYATDEERKEARRKQQREYRERKKLELKELKEKIKEQN